MKRERERERERERKTALLFLFEQIETCINMKLIFFHKTNCNTRKAIENAVTEHGLSYIILDMISKINQQNKKELA